MSDTDPNLPLAPPPISSSTDAQPQETLLLRGAFDPPATPGTLGRLDRFEILRLLGEGGMGQVYLAREPRTDTRVAVKILRPQMAADPQSVHRFLTEARHMYRLSHPRILRVLEVSDRKEGPYYVMPYVEGGSLLGQYAPDRPMPTERILTIAGQIAEALAHAHAHGLIHRDLKPGNVLLDNDGNAYLTDFGLVRTVFNDSLVDASASHLEGTAPYMSPAVARGEAEDTRCDIYAFGALLYELLTGQPPYTGRTSQIILDQVLKGPPPPLREVNPKASPALVKIAEGCLARELHARYTTMMDVMSDLALAAKGALPLGPHQQEQRRRLPRIAAVLVGTLAVAGLVGVAVRQLSFSPVGPKTTGVVRPASGGHSQETTVPADVNSIPFAYTVTNGTVTIVKYTGPGGTVTIPERINGLPVTDVGDYAFADCNLTSVTIPATVAHLSSKEPFFRCNELVSISVDASNTAYSSEDGVLFDKAKTSLLRFPLGRIGSYEVPASVTNIGYAAFWRRHGLSRVTVPVKVVNIEDWAFAECANLTGIYFNGNAPIIGSAALKDLSNATVYYRPGTTGWGKTFGGRPTAEWNGETMEADKTLPTEASAIPPTAKTQGPFVYTVTNGAATIVKYDGPGGDVTIPRTINGLPVTHIGNSAFRGCTSLTRITIPNTVTDIGHSAFYGCTGFDRVEIPDSVTNMSDWAFAATGLTQVRIPARVNNIGAAPFGHCERLTFIDVDTENAFFSSVDGILFNKDRTCLLSYAGGRDSRYVVPETVKEIRYWAFAGSTNLPSIVIPSSVTNIGRGAFWQCARLAEVTIPNRVNAIADRTFAGCSGLTSVTIPAGVVAIGEYAFGSCTGLSRVTIPAGVTSLGPKPFAACTGLTAIMVDDANLSYSSSADGVVFNKEKTCLVSCPAGRAGNYVIPDSVASIGYRAFKDCANLTRVTTPSSVTRIEGEAFSDCTRLIGVYFNGNSPRFASNAFNGTDNAIVYHLPGTKGWGKAFGGRPTAVWNGTVQNEFTYTTNNNAITITKYTGPGGDVTIPGTINGLPVTVIGDRAFNGCGGLTSVTLPDSVTRIEPFAFGKCFSLASVEIPWGATRIGEWAFNGCGALTSVIVPSGVSNIADRVFFGCSSLASVVIPSGATNIGAFAFGKCGSLTSIALPPAVTRIGEWAFNGCGALTSVVVPAGVSNIEDRVFFDCGSLASVMLPSGATNIGMFAFGKCRSLTSVTVPSGVNSIGTWAFNGCSLLEGVYFKGDAPSLGCDVFQNTQQATVYYRPGTKGWGPTFGGRPTAVWNGSVQATADKGGLYMVVDLSEGTNATRYPVTYLDAVPAGGWTDTYKTEKLVLRRIEPGTFVMGSPEDEMGHGQGETQHAVILTEGFYVGVFEVTQRQWERVMGDWPSYFNNPKCRDARPLDKMTYEDIRGAKDSANWPAANTVDSDSFMGRLRARTGQLFDLPTEAQWEYACRAGTTTALNSGKNLTAAERCPNVAEVARYNGNAGDCSQNGDTGVGTAKVGCYPPNAWGLYDMYGNVWEWCLDWSGDYSDAESDPVGASSGSLRAIRGGGWTSRAVYCRSAFHGIDLTPDHRYYDLGFRIVLRKSLLTDDAAASPSNTSKLPPTSKERTPFTYTTNHGAITLTKYTGPGDSVAIPSAINGLPVIGIGDRAFFRCTGLTRVTVPAGVVRIGAYAFCDCANLASVTIPDSVTDIGGYAFHSCKSLARVSIPNSVTSLAANVFFGCERLSDIAVDPSHPAYSRDEIGVLFNKDRSTLVRCPPGAAGRYTIPGTVSVIGDGAFWGNGGLTAIDIPGRVTKIGNDAFNQCTNLTSVTLPSAVNSVGSRAFMGCTRLQSLNIPASVTKLPVDAFVNCSELNAIHVVPANTVFSSEDDVLFNKGKTLLLRYPAAKTGHYVVPEGVNEIGNSAFEGSCKLTGITIPGTVKCIGGYAFIRCGALTNARLEEGVASIGQYAFRECSQLTSFSLPASIALMGPNPFKNCGSLTSIVVNPANAVYSSDAEGVVFDKGKTVLVNYPSGRTGHYEIPAGVVRLREWAFEDAGKLTSVAFPASVEHLEYPAFQYCRALTAICFRGDAPEIARAALLAPSMNNATVWHHPGSKGWGKTFGSRPTASGTISGDFLMAENSGIVSVILFLGSGGDVAIPAMVDGVPVGRIGPKAFQNCTNLTSVTIPPSVSTVDNLAFADCTGLTNVILSAGISRIVNASFQGCSSLTSVSIPASVTYVGPSAFRGCSRLESVFVDERNSTYSDLDGVLLNKERSRIIFCPMRKKGRFVVPKGVVEIGEWAFAGCTEVTQVVLSDSVASLRDGALASSAITDLVIPAGVTNIGCNAMQDCNRLSGYSVDAANRAYCDVDGVLFNKAKTQLVFYPGARGGDYRVPDGVTSIGGCAFTGNPNITHVTIPEGVRTIEAWTFVSCASLATVTIPASVTNLVDHAFGWCENLTALCFKGDAPAIQPRVFMGSLRATVYYRPGTQGWGKMLGRRPTAVWDPSATVTRSPSVLVNGPFTYTVTNNSVTISTYTEPDRAVMNTEGIERLLSGLAGVAVTIPETINGLPVTCIGDRAFMGCRGLTRVTIPNSVVNIGTSVLKNCINLADVVIPSSVRSIGGEAFRDCSSLATVTIPGSVTNIAWGSFWGCSGLTDVTLPGRLTRLDNWSFSDCTALASITVPASVSSMGREVFRRCANLTAVNFKGDAPSGASDTSIFAANKKAIIYYLPGTTGWGKEFGGRPTAVWDSEIPFTYTTNNGAITLTKYTGPGGAVAVPGKIDGLPVTVIGDRAFDRCSGLTRVEVPASVKSIGDYAFRACVNLKGVTLPESGTFVSTNAFEGCRPGVIDDLYATLQRRGYSRDMHMRPREDPFAQLRKKK